MKKTKIKLTARESREVRTLANLLMLSGMAYEIAVHIVGMRLSAMRKFSIQNVERAFQDCLQ